MGKIIKLRRINYMMNERRCASARTVVQHELDDVFVIMEGLDVNDRIVLHEGDKVKWELRKPGPATK